MYMPFDFFLDVSVLFIYVENENEDKRRPDGKKPKCAVLTKNHQRLMGRERYGYKED